MSLFPDRLTEESEVKPTQQRDDSGIQTITMGLSK